jgi:photosystem II protein
MYALANTTRSAAVSCAARKSTARPSLLRASRGRVSLNTVAFREDKQSQGKKNSRAVFDGKGYDKSAVKASPATAAFTRRREVFTGRIAMSGFLACVIGEILTGRGAIGQLALETRLSPNLLTGVIGAFVLYNFVTAVGPGSPTWSDENQADVQKRPSGPVQNKKANLVERPGQFLGIPGFEPGFTKRNELLVGRVAMLGFAAELVGELYTGGKGPLGQLGFDMNSSSHAPQNATIALLLWSAFWGFSAVGYNNFGQTEGDEDIY